MFHILFFVLISVCFIFSPIFAKISYAGGTAIVLRSQDLHAYNLAIDGFVKECKKNDIVVKSIEDMAGRLETGRKIIKRFTNESDKPDLFLAVGVLAATLAKKSIKDVPVIFCMVVNYHRFNLEAPNISGIASEILESRSIIIYKEIISDLKSIGVIYDPFKTKNIVDSGKKCFFDLGLKLFSAIVKSEREVRDALKKIIDKIDALWLVPDSTVISKKSFSYIYEITLKNRIPILCTSDVFVKAGALVGVYPNYTNIGIEAGQMAYEILKKENLDYIYVKYPKQLDIAINLETASKIKLNITKDIYKRYHVIEYP